MFSTDSDATSGAATPWFWRALTVAERLVTPGGDGGAHPVITERQLDRWRTLPALQVDGVWLRKLASTPLLDPAAWHSRGKPVPQVSADSSHDRCDAWMHRLAAAYITEAPEEYRPSPFLQDASPAASPLRPWLQLASPLVEPALAALAADASAACDEAQEPLIDVTAWRHDWLAILEQQLLPVLVRTLTLELQVARLRGDLEGDTPEARFAAFASRLARRDVCGALIAEYPGLARQLAEHVSTWQVIACQFRRRLEEDIELLQAHFGGGPPLGALTQLQARGDRHRGGQTVMVCGFASGVRVVYKPRSLSVEQHFQTLLKDLNARGFEPAFRTLAVLDRGTHGWVECVTAQPCEDRASLARFYRRQGAHLALLHALDATDFHYENLIAAGEYPVLLDLEALFHASQLEAEGTRGAHRRASDCLSASVLRVGLLPWRGPDDEQGRSLDVGGLTASADGAEGPLQLGIESAGRDEMRLVRKPSRLDEGQHLPKLAGHTVRLEEYLADIDAGFKAMYELLVRHRDALLADGGPLQAFGGAETRVILRGSEAYARLLQESLHPDLLRDAVDRDRHFDQLWGAFPHTDRFDGLIASEQDDLREGDIPIFTCRPAARHLWDSRGRCHTNLLTESPLQRVRQRLCAFDADDLAFQRWLIRMAMAAELSPAKEGSGTPAPVAAASLHGTGVSRRRLHARGTDGTDARTLLSAAGDIGDRLAATAFRADGSATWVGLTSGRHRQVLRHLPLDLYSGVAGVACFLAQLGVQGGQRRYTKLAGQALETVLDELDPWLESTPDLGAYTGVGGIVYALALLGQSLRRPELFERAHGVVSSIAARVAEDDQFDVLGGVAGLAASILALQDVAPLAASVQVARRCGEHLVEHAQPQRCGLGWAVAGLDAPALGGFSHGAAGISWVLLKLAGATGGAHFRSTAMDALAFDRSLLDAGAGQWRDLRRGAHGAMSAWCHGSAGIGLARLDSQHFIGDLTVHEEVHMALHSTWARGLGRHACLCHGDAGNLDLFLEAQAHRIGDALFLEETRARLAHGLCATARQAAQAGHIDTPGLMGGLAGVGWGLLRAACPEAVPSVLLLQARPTALAACTPRDEATLA